MNAIPESATCWTCGYSLRGLTEHRCPECGRVFDPAEPNTMNIGRPLSRMARWILRPPSNLMISAYVLGASPAIVAASVPRDGLLAIALSAAFVLVGGAIWLVHTGLATLVARRYRIRLAINVANDLRWVAFLFVAAALAIVLLADIPARARFLLSLPSLDALADQAIRDPTSLPSERWVGLYYVDRIRAVPGGVSVRFPGAGFLDDVGLVRTTALSAPPADTTYHPYLGGWSIWDWHW